MHCLIILLSIFTLQSCIYNQNYKNSAVEDLTSQNPEYSDRIKTNIKESEKEHNYKNNFDNKANRYSYTIEDRLSFSHNIGSLTSTLHVGLENNQYVHKIKMQTFCSSSENNFLAKPLSYKKLDWKIQNHKGQVTTDHDGFLNISVTDKNQSAAFRKLILNYENKDYELVLDILKKEMILEVNCD